MFAPHIHVPYDVLRDKIGLIRERRYNLEIFFSGGNLDLAGPDEALKIKEMLDYSPSLSIHAPFMDLCPGAVDRKVREVTRERFSQVLDMAEVLRPKSIVFHSGYEKWKYGHKVDIWLEASLDMWRGFLGRASSIGTVIAIENIFEDQPGNLGQLMEALGPDRAGICFDTGHFNLFSKEPLSVWMRELGPHIVELHLHDNDGGYDSHLPIGEGSFDFSGLFDSLAGRDLIQTLEVHNPEGIDRSIEALSAYHNRSRA